eukprot:1179691-Prorocentrum_minimum.AAC.1
MSVSIPIGERCLELSSVIWTPRERCQCVSKVGSGSDVTSCAGTIRLEKVVTLPLVLVPSAWRKCVSKVRYRSTSRTGTVRLEKGLRSGGDVTSRTGTVRLEKGLRSGTDVTSRTGTVRLEKGLRSGTDVTSRAGTVRLEK